MKGKLSNFHYIYNSWKEGKELFIEVTDGPGSSLVLPSTKDDGPPINEGASTSCSNPNGIYKCFKYNKWTSNL